MSNQSTEKFLTTLINLRFGLLNAENLFLLFDQSVPPHFDKMTEAQWQRLSSSVYENKPLKKNLEIAKIFNEEQPDIMMLCEVGGPESLRNFNEMFLRSDYNPYLIEGNSDRNIDIGFLVKKELDFRFELKTNKNRELNFLYPHEALSQKTGYPIRRESQLFSRDCAELHLFSSNKDEPFLIILLAHLKSRLDPEKIDPGGVERRSAEFRTCLMIYKELSQKFSNTPIIFCGDMNGYAGRDTPVDSEFAVLYKETDLLDILEIINLGPEQRATFYQIKNGGYADGRQIDYCFLPASLHANVNLKNSYVYRYKDEFGFPLQAPNSVLSKMNLPSDHYPIFFTLENLKT